MAASPKVHPDQSLIEGIRNQDRHTLNLLYSQYYPGILSFIRKNSGTEEEAKDIFQEAIIIVFRKARDGTLTLTSPLASYLISISRNLWFNTLKKKSFTSEVTNEVFELSIDESDIEETINERAKDKLFREKFSLLGEDCRKVLSLFFDGIKMQKIAEIMGYGSVSYAKKRKFKCKEHLVELIEQDDIFQELR